VAMHLHCLLVVAGLQGPSPYDGWLRLLQLASSVVHRRV